MRTTISNDRFVGLAFIVLGVLFLLPLVTGLRFSFSDWWPLFLVLIGLGSISKGNRRGGLIIAGIGVLFLSSNLKILSISFWLLWPVVLIAIGAAILVSHSRSRDGSPGHAPAAGDDLDVSSFFSGSNQRVDNRQFTGGERLGHVRRGRDRPARSGAGRRRGHHQRQRAVRGRQAPGPCRLGCRRSRLRDVRRHRDEAPLACRTQGHAHRHRLVPLRRHRDHVLILTGGTP